MHAVKSVRGPAAGYLIGLGDRHSQNILLQERTADVVHIDLGVAFEQVCAPLACESHVCITRAPLLKRLLKAPRAVFHPSVFQ